MSSSNQRPANGGFRSVLRCAISHYRQAPSLSAPEPMFNHPVHDLDRCSRIGTGCGFRRQHFDILATGD